LATVRKHIANDQRDNSQIERKQTYEKTIGFGTVRGDVGRCRVNHARLARAQQAQEDNGIFILGSVLFSILHVPFKLATCVGTQATAAVAYTATFDVPGNYDGGTNGRDIGETARRSCTGSWLSCRRKSRVTTAD
jgi:hypothetical protein